MKKGDVRDLIYQGLKPVLAEKQFRLNKPQQGFVRKIPGGKQSLGVALWDYNPTFEFSLNMTIRLDAVEEITNQFSGSPPRYHPVTQTTITQLEYLGLKSEQGAGIKWSATTEAELAEALSDIRKIVQDRVIPFFDTYQDVTALDNAVNPEVAPTIAPIADGLTTGMGLIADRDLFCGSNHPYRAMSAITLAHLAGNKNFEKLVLRYQDELRPFSATDRDKFSRLVEFLRDIGARS